MGNFVTAHLFATVKFKTYAPTTKAYQHYALARPTFTKAIGYYDNPPPVPAWKDLVAQTPAQFTAYPSQQIEPPRQAPSNVPSGVNVVIPLSGRAGMAGRFIPGTLPRQINPTLLKIRRVTILADPANAQEIWTGYDPRIAVNECFPLIAGAARDYDIDDLSQLWLVGENATDQVFFVYEV